MHPPDRIETKHKRRRAAENSAARLFSELFLNLFAFGFMPLPVRNGASKNHYKLISDTSLP